jgi:hypothetical protein
MPAPGWVPKGLPGDVFSALLEDSCGHIWAAAGGGHTAEQLEGIARFDVGIPPEDLPHIFDLLLASLALAACAFLSPAAATPTIDDFPIVIRLAMWIDPARHDEFGASFDSLIAPRLSDHRLFEIDTTPPATWSDSVFSRLYRFENISTSWPSAESVDGDTTLKTDIQRLAVEFGTTRPA